jgi:hypothetical protein
MKGQMSVPNLLMVIATLAVFFVFMPFVYQTLATGNAGVPTIAPDYLISNSIPVVMTMFMLLSIIVYGLIR